MKLLSSLFFSVFFSLVSTIAAVAQAKSAHGGATQLNLLAQVTVDNTTSTTVTSTDTGIQIDEGNRAGGNLFHSFREFSIPTGREALFNNSHDIVNIFSRVTGGNISNINGVISANGTANLFLINPAGIIFGEGANLQLGGSFYGSTADSIIFSNGEFSATNLDNPPLITVNAPLGLNFRDEPGKIINRSVANDRGLSVAENQTLALIGGDITLERGQITTSGGHIELASIAANGRVNFEETATNLSFKYDEISNFANLELSQGSIIDASGETTGSVNLQGNQVFLTNNSRISSSNTGSQPGKDITFNAKQLLIEDNSRIITTTIGNGKAGNIKLNIAELIQITGTGFFEFEETFIRNNLVQQFNLDSLNRGTGILTGTNGRGTAGKITLNTNNLIFQEGAVIGGFVFGAGDSDQLTINATESIDIDGSGIFNSLIFGSTGNGKKSQINTANLTIKNSGIVTSSTLGSGKGGDVIINEVEEVKLLEALPGSLLSTGIFTNSIYSNGEAGNLAITTQKLTIQDGSQITSISGALLGERDVINTGGKGGDITIIAADSVQLSGFRLENSLPSIISSDTITDSNAGNISIQTGNLIISNNAGISAGNTGRASFLNIIGGSGNAGLLTIVAESMQLDDGNISTATQAGSGGNIILDVAENITLRNNSLISAQAFDDANGGNLTIDTEFIIAYPSLGRGNDILASAEQGQGGTIEITAESLLGIQERENFANNNTNDIDASSEINGLDGIVIIETPETNSFQETAELSSNVVSAEIITASNGCYASDVEDVSSLVVQGKGGISPQPIEPLMANELIMDGESETSNLSQAKNDESTNNLNLNPDSIPSHVQPVTYKDNGEPVYLARGVIKQEDGTVILTAYATADSKPRALENPYDCNQ